MFDRLDVIPVTIIILVLVIGYVVWNIVENKEIDMDDKIDMDFIKNLKDYQIIFEELI
jgi:hypothetical protein